MREYSLHHQNITHVLFFCSGDIEGRLFERVPYKSSSVLPGFNFQVSSVLSHVSNDSFQVDARTQTFSKETADELLEGSPDLVVDAIDDITTKAQLLRCCVQKDLKVVASMGAGARVR